MKIISIIIYMFILIISLGAEENAAKEKEKSGNHLDIIAYSGLYTETDLLPILFQQKTNYKASRISVLGLNYGLSSNIRFFDFEAEGQLVKHSGLMNHLEMNVFLLARWSNLFRLPVSIAFGEGISLASKNPLLENKKKEFIYTEIILIGMKQVLSHINLALFRLIPNFSWIVFALPRY